MSSYQAIEEFGNAITIPSGSSSASPEKDKKAAPITRATAQIGFSGRGNTKQNLRPGAKPTICLNLSTPQPKKQFEQPKLTIIHRNTDKAKQDPPSSPFSFTTKASWQSREAPLPSATHAPTGLAPTAAITLPTISAPILAQTAVPIPTPIPAQIAAPTPAPAVSWTLAPAPPLPPPAKPRKIDLTSASKPPPQPLPAPALKIHQALSAGSNQKEEAIKRKVFDIGNRDPDNQQSLKNQIEMLLDGIRQLNTFDWEDYVDEHNLDDSENPFTMLDKHAFWFYVSLTYFNWAANQHLLYSKDPASVKVEIEALKDSLVQSQLRQSDDSADFLQTYSQMVQITNLHELEKRAKEDLREVTSENSQVAASLVTSIETYKTREEIEMPEFWQKQGGRGVSDVLQELRYPLSRLECQWISYLESKFRDSCQSQAQLQRHNLMRIRGEQVKRKVSTEGGIHKFLTAVEQDKEATAQMVLDFKIALKGNIRIEAQEDKIGLKKLMQNNPCAVCQQDDYEDDNLIVYCDICQNCAHQQCYGSTINDEVPEGQWVCNNCLAFGYQQGLKTRCALCSQRGGFMRPTNILFGTSRVEKANKGGAMQPFLDQEKRKFDEYYQAALSSNGDVSPFEQYYWWVHLSCAQWVLSTGEPRRLKVLQPSSVVTSQQVNFREDQRFRTDSVCSICRSTQFEVGFADVVFDPLNKKLRHGIAVKCSFNSRPKDPKPSTSSLVVRRKQPESQAETCPVSFHIECARRGGYFMECSQQTGELSIFCIRHRPFDLAIRVKKQNTEVINKLLAFDRSFSKVLSRVERLQSTKWSAANINALTKVESEVISNKWQTTIVVQKEWKRAKMTERLGTQSEVEKYLTLKRKKVSIHQHQYYSKILSFQQPESEASAFKKFAELQRYLLAKDPAPLGRHINSGMRCKVNYFQKFGFLKDSLFEALKQKSRRKEGEKRGRRAMFKADGVLSPRQIMRKFSELYGNDPSDRNQL